MNQPKQPTPIFSVVWKEILDAANLRELDKAAHQISRILNLAHQRELSALYVSMKNKFTHPRKEANVLAK